MQRLKLTNDTIFRKTKKRSLKVYNLFWTLKSNKCKKFNLKHAFLCSRVIRKANINMRFYDVNNYATYLLAHSHALSTMSELFKSWKFFELSH